MPLKTRSPNASGAGSAISPVSKRSGSAAPSVTEKGMIARLSITIARNRHAGLYGCTVIPLPFALDHSAIGTRARDVGSEQTVRSVAKLDVATAIRVKLPPIATVMATPTGRSKGKSGVDLVSLFP